jgi:Adenylate and Guanylate cyclase catalytic domain/Double zinc ribbon
MERFLFSVYSATLDSVPKTSTARGRVMQCPACRHENPPQAKFCLECGARLAQRCGHCGTELPQSARFCLECGQPVGSAADARARFTSPESYTPKHLAEKILASKGALEGERKRVTVLFADLKGSMELLADRDPEEARRILAPVVAHMMEAVHHYEGTVNQVMGDGIMALFGAPIAHEDHAVRACYAALRMQESVHRYADEARRAHGVAVQIRVGLNSVRPQSVLPPRAPLTVSTEGRYSAWNRLPACNGSSGTAWSSCRPSSWPSRSGFPCRRCPPSSSSVPWRRRGASASGW